MFWDWGADSWVKFCKTSADSDKSIWELVPIISSCKSQCCPGSSLFYRNCSIVGIHRQIRLFKNCIQEYLHILNIRWHMYRVHRFDHSHQVIISIVFLYGKFSREFSRVMVSLKRDITRSDFWSNCIFILSF